MRVLLSAASAAIFMSSGAYAATTTVSYDVALEVTYVAFVNPFNDHPDDPSPLAGFQYPGTKVGGTEDRTYSFDIDPENEWAFKDNLNGNPSYAFFDSMGTYSFSIDLITGELGLSDFPNWDEGQTLSLKADNGGNLTQTVDYGAGGLVYATVKYDVLEWSVDGLPEIAPVPLPASLPLLFVGAGALFAVKRRRRALTA